MQTPAPQLLRVDLLADRHRNQPFAGDGHDRALPHHVEVGHAAIPGRRAIAHAQYARRPGAFAQPCILVRVAAKQGSHADPTHIVWDAGAGGFAEIDHRDAALLGSALHLRDFLHIRSGRRCTLHREIVCNDSGFTPLNASVAGNLAVRRGLVSIFWKERRGKQARFDEGIGIEQIVDAFARIHDACIAPALEFGFATHGECHLTTLIVLHVKFVGRHSEFHSPE